MDVGPVGTLSHLPKDLVAYTIAAWLYVNAMYLLMYLLTGSSTRPVPCGGGKLGVTGHHRTTADRTGVVPHLSGTPSGRSIWSSFLGALLVLPTLAEETAQSPSDAKGHPDEEPDSVSLELYTPPHSLSRAVPRYPRSALRKGREGWVRLHFMVDPNGKPYEIAVTESAGDDVFHRAAVRALQDSTFEPARFDGQPLDAGHFFYYHFEINSGVGVRSRFAGLYKSLMNAIREGDRERAETRLGQLAAGQSLNLSEDAYLHVAKFSYYAKWGDKRQQLEALYRAVGHKSADTRLPEELYVSLQRARFLLLVETQDFHRALETFKTLTEYDLEEPVLAALKTVVDKVKAVRLDDTAYAVQGDFGDQFAWSYYLFKDEFLFEDVEGEIEEIKLRCAKDYVFFRFDPDIRHKTARDQQPCHLQLIGDPGTTFKLVQL